MNRSNYELACMCSIHRPDYHRGKKSALDPREPDLPAVVSCHVATEN